MQVVQQIGVIVTVMLLAWITGSVIELREYKAQNPQIPPDWFKQEVDELRDSLQEFEDRIDGKFERHLELHQRLGLNAKPESRGRIAERKPSADSEFQLRLKGPLQ